MRLRKAFFVLVNFLTVMAGHLGYLQYSGNFHPVLDGVAFRAAQPEGDDLERWARESGIRSVLNLRGEHAGAGWYDDELAASARLGLTHYDFKMSARSMLPQEQATALVDLIRAAPKPLLIHCKSGSDRTGLVSALVMAAYGQDEELAEAQISIRYGHLAIPYTAAWPMDQSWEALEGWLGYES